MPEKNIYCYFYRKHKELSVRRSACSTSQSAAERWKESQLNTINLSRCIVSKEKLLCDEVALSEMWIGLHFTKHFWFMRLFLEPVCWYFGRSSTVHTRLQGQIKTSWDQKLACVAEPKCNAVLFGRNFSKLNCAGVNRSFKDKIR